ncbi:response regulator [Actinomyces capricornis]|uniref:DNA-binding response regulator n=1 Tax=Actinomyces capricornis TaxID=2755559 RepID=A0ABN6K3C2_9ACTO|nr:response regulator transcription factor [Actinomyces capricornis]BDA64070.1 DNA-binding response regulator [Actinomyces capricornis]
MSTIERSRGQDDHYGQDRQAEPIRILIAEDQGMLRASLVALLDSEPGMSVVGAAGDGAQAVARSTELRPDVVIMDIQMPVLTGIEATARICSDPALAATRVLILTMFEFDDYVLGAMRAGASGFLLKDAESQALVDAVRTLHAGQALLSPGVLERLVAQGVAAPAPGPGLRGDVQGLTPRQREVLTLIARGLSNSQIEAELSITRATCRTHISALLARLGARDRAQLVIAAYESGLIAPG